MLLKTWLSLVARWRSAFAQDRSFLRFLAVVLGLMATQGRSTITAALGVFGIIYRWSSDYRIFSRSNWDQNALFQGVIQEASSYLISQKRIVVSLDDTGIPKTSRKIAQVSLMRDPMGPKYRPNLIHGMRCLHAMLHIPPQVEDIGITGVSIGFELAPPPKKPKKKAPEEEWIQYRKVQKTDSLTARGAELMSHLRKNFDGIGLKQRMLCVVDGGYTNKTLITKLPENTDLIGRVRKDIRICEPAVGGGRKVYGRPLPTPALLRWDGCLMESHCTCFYGQRLRDVKFKDMGNILWPSGSRRRRMRLLIVIPTPYRPPGSKKLKYDEPAYLITTDLISPAQELIQAYLDRWEIEVIHRDLKTHLGLGQAQVWSEKSVPRVHPTLVAAFAMLRLASMKAFGPTRTQDYYELPRWRSPKDRFGRRKPSVHDLLTRLRKDISDAIHQTPLKPHEIYAVA
jgi:hypothetical protein